MFKLGAYNDSIADIPGTEIHIYSLLVGIAILLVVFTSWLKMYRRGIPTKTLEGSVLIIVPTGLLGARLWFVLNHTSSIQTWVDVFAVWNGGIAIEGGVITGLIVGLIIFYRASKKYRISMWVYLDCILPNVLLGQAIGRWGNFFDQQILGPDMGHPFSWLPTWMNDHLHYYGEHVEVYRQPLFLYESIADLAAFIFLAFIVPKMGFWFSKKPWKQEAEKYQPLWKQEPIVKSDYYQPWIIVKKLYLYQKWKKECWEQAYFDFEPHKNSIKEPIINPYKPIKIHINMKWWKKVFINCKNFFGELFSHFSNDAKPLNNSYNPQQYRLTYAGVTGALYFTIYGIIRTTIEPFRDQRDLMTIGSIPTSLVISIIWIFLGITLFVFAQFIARKKFRKKGWFYERQY